MTDINTPDPTIEPKPDDTIDQAAIQELLAAEDTTPKAIELDDDTTAEVRAALNAEKKEPTPKTHLPIPDQWQSDVDTTSTMLDWAFKQESVGKIEVTAQEKAIYEKAFLHDSNLCFDIEFQVGSLKPKVRVNNLTILMERAISAAIAKDEEEKLVQGTASMWSAMQQYCLVLQVQSVGNTLFAPRVEVTTPPQSVEALRDAIRTSVQTHIGSMSAARLNMLIKAVCIFEIKQKMCNENIVNREDNQGFWRPQGSV